MSFFSLVRIKANELFQDAVNLTKNVYQQADNLYTVASPWGQLLIVLRNLFSMTLYYIEDSITELNINTASRTNSIIGLARLAGHNSTRSISASGVMGLVYNGNKSSLISDTIIIPNFVKLKSKKNNLPYIGILGKDDIRYNIYTDTNKKSFFRVVQGFVESQTFTGTGYTLQTYECNSKEGIWIDNFFVNVYVNGERWKPVVSIYDMSYNEKCVVIKTGITSGIDIIFGNGNNGAIPELGSEILVEYIVNDGTIGQIDSIETSEFKFEDYGYDINGNELDLNVYFNLKLATPVLGGSNPEQIELTKLLAPTTSRSFVLAQTSNYELFFEKMQRFSYIKAYTEYDPSDPYIDNIIYLMVIPDISKKLISGKNYFNLPVTSFYMNEFEIFEMYRMIEESGQKILGSIPYFIQPDFQYFSLNVTLNIWKGYDEKVIKDNITRKISDYLLNFKRKDYIPKSDFIGIIETVEGVDSVNVDFISKVVEDELVKLLDREMVWDSVIDFSDEENVLIEKFYYPFLYDNDSKSLNYLDANEGETLDYFLKMKSVQLFLSKHFDSLGNIILDKNKYPVFKGGWNDRYGNYFDTNLSYERLCPINYYIYKRIEPTSNEKLNKISINQIKNLS